MENTISSSNNPENTATQYVGLSGENISQEQIVKVEVSYSICKQNAVVAKVTNKKFMCDICYKNLGTRLSLKLHKQTHTGERPFKCHKCTSAFIRKQHLKEHMDKHQTKKPFECLTCSKFFSTKSNLNTHNKIHTGEKNFECEICKNRFTQKHHLDGHIKTHTGDKPYKCQICGWGFAQKINLTMHQKRHTGEKSYICEKCSKSFCQNRDLKKHQKRHDREGLFKCNDSGKDFFRKESLSSHQQNKVCKGSEKPVSDKHVTSTEQIHAQVQMQTAGNVIATGATPFYQYQHEETKNLEESVVFGQDQAVSSTRIPMPPMPTQSTEKILSRAQFIKIKKFRETETKDEVSLPVLSTLPMEQGSVDPTMLETPLVESNFEQPLDLSLPKTSQNSMPQTSQNSSLHRPCETSTSHATEDLNQGASASGNPTRYMPYQQIETSPNYRVQNSASFLC